MRSYTLPSFGGLDLRNDAEETPGALDLLNVDFDNAGRVKTRDGSTVFTQSAAASAYRAMTPYYDASGNVRLLAATSSRVDEINTSGTVLSNTAITSSPPTFARFGTPTEDRVYIAYSGAGPKKYTFAGGFTAPVYTGTPPQRYIAVQYPDNRMVGRDNSDFSRLKFSDPGDPETWGANNYVDLSPGDGEVIAGMCSWNNLLFVFKGSRFFVFYGNSTDSTGNPVFNYHTIEASFNLLNQGYATPVVAAPEGVYVLGDQGLWLTTGGSAQLVSALVEPIFRNTVPATCQVGAWVKASAAQPRLHYWNGKVLIAYSEDGSANTKVLVFDTHSRTWTAYDWPVLSFGTFRPGNVDQLMFGKTTPNHIYTHYPNVGSTDNGSAIVSRYRTGFGDYGTPATEKHFREVILDGSGTVNVKHAVNDAATLSSAQSVTLGTAPAVAQGRDRRGFRGRNASVEISASSGAWSVSRMVVNVMSERASGAKATL